ncbi:hypothetical protein CU097_010362 [Rhizopus azygosporus]|uniref:Uncharacterized protein n=1 Tax=Rhizopus azygosporus TaxID=86630 RepID=A0A367JVZ8_RHIAZ|nr:hypothetical protein CU097_010362 [Rhizopus azygosporus]
MKGDIRCINLTVKNEKDDSIIEKVVFEINSVLKHVDIPLSKDWIPAEVDATSKRIIPIKSASMDIFQFNTFIMENSIKGKERCS